MYDYDIDTSDQQDNRAADQKALDTVKDKQKQAENVQNLYRNAQQLDKNLLGNKYSDMTKDALGKTQLGRTYNQVMENPSLQKAIDFYHNMKDWNIFRPWGQGAENARSAKDQANGPGGEESQTGSPVENPVELNTETPNEPVINTAPQAGENSPIEPNVGTTTDIATGTGNTASGATDIATGTGASGVVDTAAGANAGTAADTVAGSAAAGGTRVAVAAGEAVAGGSTATTSGAVAGGVATGGVATGATGGAAAGAVAAGAPTGGLGTIPGAVIGLVAGAATGAAASGGNKIANDARDDANSSVEHKSKGELAKQNVAHEIKKANDEEEGTGKAGCCIGCALFASPLLLIIIVLVISVSVLSRYDKTDSDNAATLISVQNSINQGVLTFDSSESQQKILDGDVSDKTLKLLEYLSSNHELIKIYYVKSLQAGTENEAYEFDIGIIDKIKCTNTATAQKAIELPVDLTINADWTSMVNGLDGNLLCALGYYPTIDKPTMGKYADLFGPPQFRLSDITKYGPVAAQEKTVETIDEIIGLNKFRGIANDSDQSLLPYSLTINSKFYGFNLMDNTKATLRQALSTSLNQAYVKSEDGVGLQVDPNEKGIHVSFF